MSSLNMERLSRYPLRWPRVGAHVALDDVGFLGQLQQHAVGGQEELAADALVARHAGDALGLFGQGDGHHVQSDVELGLDLLIVLLIFTLWRYKKEEL